MPRQVQVKKWQKLTLSGVEGACIPIERSREWDINKNGLSAKNDYPTSVRAAAGFRAPLRSAPGPPHPAAFGQLNIIQQISF